MKTMATTKQINYIYQELPRQNSGVYQAFKALPDTAWDFLNQLPSVKASELIGAMLKNDDDKIINILKGN